MSMLTRWDPYREMTNFRRLVNRMFEEPYYPDSEQSFTWDLPLDVAEKEDEFVVKASIPGVKPDDLEITYNNGALSIRGEVNKEEEHEEKSNRYLMRERYHGTFMRSISLPSTVNSGSIEADYKDGILTLHLPKAEEVKPKRIPINSSNHMIEGSTKNENKK
jgi:HSP20 family protein